MLYKSLLLLLGSLATPLQVTHQFDHAEEVHEEWHEHSGQVVGRLAGDLALTYAGGKLIGWACNAATEAAAVAELAEAGCTAEEINEFRTALTIADKAQRAEKLLALAAENEALVPALKRMGLLMEVVEEGVVMAEAVEGAAAIAKQGNTIKNVTLAHAEAVAEAVGGGVKQIPNGYRITTRVGNKKVIIRLMREGSGKRSLAYYRVAVDNKPCRTIQGVVSSAAHPTHININTETFIDEIKSILQKILLENAN